MPILMIALLALMVFGIIGILLAAAVILENSSHVHAAKVNIARPVNSGTIPSPNPKPR
jgi:hypothetical protein